MVDTQDENKLVEDFLSGNESSFNILAARYKQKIYWHARRMTGNHLDADEVVQEVLLVMFQKLKDFRFKSSLYTWIYRITATRSINYLRKKKLRSFFSLDDIEHLKKDESNDVISKIENREKLKRLDQALQKLPLKQREVFIMRAYNQLSYEEIAEISGKSIGGLKANYFHAVKKITEMMKDE